MASESMANRSFNNPAAGLAAAPWVFDHLLDQFDAATVVWQPLRQGIDISRIYGNGDGPSAAFVRYQPGASLQRHRHVGYEHIFILSGSQVDDLGEHSAGAFLIHPPGTSHTIRSEQGCLVLAIWEKPVVF